MPGLLTALGLLLGGYWYLRNWLVTGNPLYPVQVDLGAWTLFPGAFGSEQIDAWVNNKRVPGRKGLGELFPSHDQSHDRVSGSALAG